jgi:hypothetical protein
VVDYPCVGTGWRHVINNYEVKIVVSAFICVHLRFLFGIFVLLFFHRAPELNIYDVINIWCSFEDGFAVRILLILSKWVIALPLIRICCFGYAFAPRY